MNKPLRLTLTIDSLNSSGEGVARLGRDVYFVPGALPGEQAEVLLDGRRRKIWQTRLLNILQPSAHRTDPLCPHYKRCGGCDLQHLAYEQQVAFKQQRVARELERQKIPVERWAQPIISEPWHYRRKARLGVRISKQTQENIVGFREAASSHLTNIDKCLVLPEHPALDWQQWRTLINKLQAKALITQIEVVYADNALALVLRVLKPLSTADQQQLIQFVTAMTDALPVQLWLKLEKGAAAHCIYPEQVEPLTHTVDQQTLTIQVDDFVQVNAAVNQAMVAQALQWLNPQKDDCIWDMFAGHGNFSMALARRSQQVWAVEGSAEMVASLQQQATALGLPINALCMDLTQPELDLPKADAVLLDPPRAGALELMPYFIKQAVPKILYVSCDAATLARDLSLLVAAGYEIKQAGIMDMFPQTHHVETMVLAEKKV